MKRIIFFIIIVLFNITITSANIPCDTHYSNYELFKDKYNNADLSDNRIGEYKQKADNNLEQYDICYNKYKESFDKWVLSYNNWSYSDAISYFENALEYYPELESISVNLSLSYTGLAETLTYSWKYDEAIQSYRKSIDYSISQEDIEYMNTMIGAISIAPTNDSFSWTQYYLHSMNIPNAWTKVTNNEEVIVAVVDDGMNIHHPDLQKSLWISEESRYWESKVRDFVWDGIDNLSTWDHWTMVSWIIAAEINNNEWIAGISKNAKIMPLRVFGIDGEVSTDKIVDAIKYAIDNGANIINLSLGQSQFKYSTSYDDIIRRAYDENIVVVIAGWNWDILTSQKSGIDLSKNPIAPVCNNGGSNIKYSIWVYSSDIEWWRTNWTNYWDCTHFMAPWVDIVSTSIPVFNSEYGGNYNIQDGTSFSAPIVSGIIALGYNQYGQISPNIIYDALNDSLTENKVWNKFIDAEKYIDILGEKLNLDTEFIILKNNYKIKFSEKLWNKLKKFSISSLSQLSSDIDNFLETDIKNSLRAKLQALSELVTEELEMR